MISVMHKLDLAAGSADPLPHLVAELDVGGVTRVSAAFDLAYETYQTSLLSSGESTWQHALGTALVVSSLGLDADVRVAAMLFAVMDYRQDAPELLKVGFGDTAAKLVQSLH
ncbi:MAG: HD domain-containing protein, partial [Rugosibacter sp.]